MITPEQKDILNEYASIKKDIKTLEEKADALNPKVTELMQANDIGEIEIADLGKLSMASRRNWKYPADVMSWEEDLKAKKKEAEQRGTATYSEKHYIIFKGNKEE